MNSSTKALFEERAQLHGIRAVLDPNDIYGQRNKYIDRFLKHLIANEIPRNAGKILDFGCGNGRMKRAFLRRTKEQIIGVDVSASLIEEAKASSVNEDRIQFETIPESPPYSFPSNHFDVITCCWVFQHINDDQSLTNVFAELYRLLKPGGLLITVDRVSQNRIVQLLDEKPFLTVRTAEEEESLASDVGFTLEKMRIAWVTGRFWQKVLKKFKWFIWWYFIPFMSWWDLRFCKHPSPKVGERAECLFVMRKTK